MAEGDGIIQRSNMKLPVWDHFEFKAAEDEKPVCVISVISWYLVTPRYYYDYLVSI